jgi:hypothetical protein
MDADICKSWKDGRVFSGRGKALEGQDEMPQENKVFQRKGKRNATESSPQVRREELNTGLQKCFQIPKDWFDFTPQEIEDCKQGLKEIPDETLNYKEVRRFASGVERKTIHNSFIQKID